MARRRNKGEERRIAQERIEHLVALAEDALREQHVERANRYAELAWRIRLRYQLSRTAIDGRICRACHAFLHPGHSVRIRLTGGKRSATCLRCGHTRRRILAVREGRSDDADGEDDDAARPSRGRGRTGGQGADRVTQAEDEP